MVCCRVSPSRLSVIAEASEAPDGVLFFPGLVVLVLPCERVAESEHDVAVFWRAACTPPAICHGTRWFLGFFTLFTNEWSVRLTVASDGC